MEFKGTKGEWSITEKGDISYSLNDGDIDVWQLNDGSMEECEANAKLIAAAPELLAALQEAVVGYDWKKETYPENWSKADDEHYEKCVAVIKKALL